MNIRPYKLNIRFNNKKYEILIFINDNTKDDDEYHYDMDIKVDERISGNEFQKLKKYIENEGYIDEAIKYYEKYKY